MIPMVFCASLLPWLSPIIEALSNCKRPNVVLTWWGRQFRNSANSSPITTKPTIRPMIGARIIGRTTLGQSPSTCCVTGLTTDQRITSNRPLAEAIAAPQRPPIRAWLELDGSPRRQVVRFQITAATSALRSV